MIINYDHDDDYIVTVLMYGGRSSPAAAQHASDASRLFGGGTPVVQTNSGRARMSTPR